MGATVLVVGLLLTVAVAPVAAVVATIYLEANYSGLSLDMDIFSGNTSLPWTLGIASLRILPGYELVGYDAPAFQGYYMVWDADAPSLGSLWSSRILSFKIRSATNDLVLAPNNLQNVVNVYQASKFSGQMRSLPLGKDTFNSPLARAVMSIKVTPGYLFVAYDGPDQSGKSTSFAADTGDLAAWDARILSYDLRRISNATVTPATLVPPPRPSTTPAPTSTNDEATNYTTIIIACTAAVVVVVGLVGLCLLRRMKAAKAKGPSSSQGATSRHSQDESASLAISFDAIYKLALDGSLLSLQQLIGCGAYAEVWRGSFQSQPVAVKTLLSNRATNQGIQDFVHEIALMASFDSPYIVRVLGATWHRPLDLKCIMELMNLGDLKDYLAHHSSCAYPWSQKLRSIQAIANALVYLHSLNIIHRDLKSRNVLLDSKKGTKIVDFGVSREDTNATMTTGVGTFRWMAPEVLQDSYYSVAADIYSFGMVLSEFDAHHIPYQNVKNTKTGLPLVDTAIIGAVLNGALRPEFSSSCPASIRDLALLCLAHDPANRPTAYQIAVMLKEIQL
ncbi:TKL protein kinase [Saprolegnia diclina VS20]|uniref:TKL protein kinase n=1 Tax=Saprolegnia diclina (strain VS20) TaxID=1156394 RepID=T0Q4L4_SAPDV|nr:TKL protein kinase [Saprolegnia diclina VS20]EQC32774.1 TKL protein kinase [Saprolegnia diclina VS20]|eukprot:XP_008613918.1 TKL protein kinase [Saprolegnia diclina VS20]